jgi:hypothetical protein
MSFSEILEALGVSSSFLTYHIENLGELVSKTDSGKYRLSTFGEAAMATMTKVEDIPRNIPSQNENLERAPKFATKSSITAYTITHVYMLALVVSVILASLYFVNYASSSDPFTPVAFYLPLLIHPGQNYSFYVAIDNRPMPSYVYFAWRFDENNTYWFKEPPIGNTLTDWQAESVHLDLVSNATFKFSRALVWNETNGTAKDRNFYYIQLSPGSFGSDLDITDVSQPSLYEYVVTDVDTFRDVNETMLIQVSWQEFNKPYFYYGVAGLVIGLLYPAIILTLRLLGRRHMPEPTTTTH